MTYEVTVENTKSGKAKKVIVEAADKFEAMAKVETMRWAAVGAQRTMEDVLAARRKAAEMGAKADADQRWESLTPNEKVAEFERYDQ